MALALMTRLAGAEGADVPSWWDHTANSTTAHRGTLPNRPDTWRAVLGLPSRTMLQGAVARTVAGRGSRTEILALDAAWTDAWLPELMNWFRVIDDSFLKERPEYRAEAGRVWHPLLDFAEAGGENTETMESASSKTTDRPIGRASTAASCGGLEQDGPTDRDAAGASPETAASPKRVRARRKTAAPVGESQGTSETAAAPKEQPGARPKRTGGKKTTTGKTTTGKITTGKITTGKITTGKAARKTQVARDPIQAFWDVGPWRPTLHALERAWDSPLPGSAQARLWDDGATYLSDGTKEGAAKVRSIVGRLIKEYGEQAVAQGLAAVMTRPARPADPVAFLRKTVHAVVHGSPAEERARAQRAKVPL
jgi:hypothetical protein